MPDEIITDNLKSILECIVLIENRFAEITHADDFVKNPDGVFTLDAIAMRLQIIGELLKKIDKSDPSILRKYPHMQWDNIMRLRDIISHHYDVLDHEIIFDICKNHIPQLTTTVKKIIEDSSP
jgi:uncharacterized protein with HEPN domain